MIQDREFLARLVSEMIKETGFHSDGVREEVYWLFALMAVAEEEEFKAARQRFLDGIDREQRQNLDTYQRLVVQLDAARRLCALPPGSWLFRREHMALFLDAREITDPEEREATTWRRVAKYCAGAVEGLEREKLMHPEHLDPQFPRQYAEKHPWIRQDDGFAETVETIADLHIQRPLIMEYLRLKHPDLYVLQTWPVRAREEANRIHYALQPVQTTKAEDDEIEKIRTRSARIVGLVQERDNELASLSRRGISPDSEDYQRIQNLYEARIARLTEDEE